MHDASMIAEEHRLIDIDYLVTLTGLSKPTLRRLNSARNQSFPKGLKIGRSVRWRLRSGDPATGILDWVEAGCQLNSSDASDHDVSGQRIEEDAHGC